MAPLTAGDLQGWIPIRLYGQAGQPWVDWCYVGEQAFREPFFDHHIDRCLDDPFKLLFRRQTPAQCLIDLERVEPCVEPSGFIFHLSRCGSTLVSQMLAASQSHMVVSEASIVDAVLKSGPIACEPNDHRIGLLRGLLHAMNRRIERAPSHFFVKFDSWHTVYLPLISLAFPTVPWIFLYREPIEVLVSLSRRTGGRQIPGVVPPAELGLGPEMLEMDQDRYNACILTRICRAAVETHARGSSYLVNYRQLPEYVVDRLPEIFGFACSDQLRQDMLQRAKFDGKSPQRLFAFDSSEKHRNATEAIRAAAQPELMEIYAQLESIRTSEID